MKQYTGSQLHGCLKTNVNETKECSSLDLGMIPEDVMNQEINPLLTKLNEVLNKHNVYIWATMGYIENTENEL